MGLASWAILKGKIMGYFLRIDARVLGSGQWF